jgi:chromosome partitioning protein
VTKRRESVAPVVALASTKGGVGKTTLAFCLSIEFARRLSGATEAPSVEVIDGDPNATLADGVRLGQPPGVWAETATAETLMQAVAAARQRARLVLIDLEGSANEAMLYACGKADLVLIPAQPSLYDVIEAMKTHAVVARAADLTGRDIPCRIILSRTPVLYQQVTSHCRAQFEKRGLPMLAAEFMERTAFRKMTFAGQPVEELDPKGADSGAARNVRAIADELTTLLGGRL